MSRTVVALTVSVVCVLLLWVAPAHGASPICGESDSDGRPVKAHLALDDEAPELVTERGFGRKIGERGLTLVYTVKNCEISESAQPPYDPPTIYTPATGDAIPDGVLRLNGDPSVEDGRYVVRLKFTSDSFGPGAYAGFVELRAPWLNPVRSAVAVSRSEHNFGWALLCGAGGAIAGFVLFALLHMFKNDKLLVSKGQFAIAGVLSICAGALAAMITNYSNQDIWVLGDNWWGAAGVGFSAATSGAMAVLLAPVFKTDTAANREKAAHRAEANRTRARSATSPGRSSGVQ